MVSARGAFYPRVPNVHISVWPVSCYTRCYNRPSSAVRRHVKTATPIDAGSSTDVVDVSAFLDKTSEPINYLKVADSNGRIYCTDRNIKTGCWLRMVKIAEDCQSASVELRANEAGVYLTSKRRILEGEPLSMWFDGSVLTLLDMPYLTYLNIQDENDYRCHHCNQRFHNPNPLKIHLLTRCGRLGMSDVWSLLAKRFKEHPPAPSDSSLNVPDFILNFTFSSYRPADLGWCSSVSVGAGAAGSLNSSSNSDGSPQYQTPSPPKMSFYSSPPSHQPSAPTTVHTPAVPSPSSGAQPTLAHHPPSCPQSPIDFSRGSPVRNSGDSEFSSFGTSPVGSPRYQTPSPRKVSYCSALPLSSPEEPNCRLGVEPCTHPAPAQPGTTTVPPSSSETQPKLSQNPPALSKMEPRRAPTDHTRCSPVRGSEGIEPRAPPTTRTPPPEQPSVAAEVAAVPPSPPGARAKLAPSPDWVPRLAVVENIACKLSRYNQRFDCVYCNKSFSKHYGLKIHIRTHTGFKPLKCKTCGKSFGDPSNMKKHLRTHVGEFPYKCKTCHVTWQRRSDLIRHVHFIHFDGLGTAPSETDANANIIQ